MRCWSISPKPCWSSTSSLAPTRPCREYLARLRWRTDGWQGYEPLRAKGYHPTVTVIGKGSRRALRLLPAVHRVVSLLKRWLVGTHHGRVQAKHLQRYLDEFAFRFNRRKSRHVGMIFFRAQQGVQTGPLPYRTLVSPARKHNRWGLQDRSGQAHRVLREVMP
jgi:hypothetical protein